MTEHDRHPQPGEVTLMQVEGFRAVSLRRAGPYWKLSGPLTELREFMEELGLDASGPPIGIFYDDPETTPPEETQYHLAYPVQDETAERARAVMGTASDAASDAASGTRSLGGSDARSDFEVLELPPTEAAALEFQGAGSDSGPAYGKVQQWVAARGRQPSGPPREVYLAEPGTLPRGQVHLIIQQPVAPRER